MQTKKQKNELETKVGSEKIRKAMSSIKKAEAFPLKHKGRIVVKKDSWFKNCKS